MVRMGYVAWCALMNRQPRSGSLCSHAQTRPPPLRGCRAPDQAIVLTPQTRLLLALGASQPVCSLAGVTLGLLNRCRDDCAVGAWGQIEPDQLSGAGTPADKRLGNAAASQKYKLERCPQTGVNSNFREGLEFVMPIRTALIVARRRLMFGASEQGADKQRNCEPQRCCGTARGGKSHRPM